MNHQIDELARAAREAPSAETMGDLWRAACALPGWTLLGRVKRDRFEPLTMNYEHAPAALAFTDEARARAFLEFDDLHAARPDVLTLAVPAATDLLDELRGVGVAFVIFNEGSAPFAAALDQLVRIYAAHGPR